MECKTCHKSKPQTEFFRNKSAKSGFDSSCKFCRGVKNQAWRDNNWVRTRELNKKSQYKRSRELRKAAIEAYGGKCNCCGERTHEFLTLEHINGIPPEDRYSNGKRKRTVEIYRRLEREGWPKENYTVLCYNCNCAKAHTGTCPHEGVV